jgi:hypothetical protein
MTADTFEEVKAAQIYILYAVIGSIIGILVVQLCGKCVVLAARTSRRRKRPRILVISSR